jgi:hypothetical protein
MYGVDMDVQPVQGRNWSYNAVMKRGDEIPVVAEEVAVQILETRPVAPGFNEALRESSEIVANVDKGFQHYVKYFRDELPVTAAVRIEKAHHGEYGWGVYFEQGRHRSVLAGTLANRSVEEAWEDTMWTACAEWASFGPVLGQSKIHREILWAPDEFTHIFEGSKFGVEYANASEFRKRVMERFVIRTQKFGQAYEWHSHADLDPPKRADYYSYHGAASRRIRISDGPSLWEEGQVVFVPPPSQEVAGRFPQFTFQSGGRAQVGPGEAGTGSGVSAPD